VVCILNLIVENPVFSWLAARKFEIPALVVILSVIFWGWLLGLAGMLFSRPVHPAGLYPLPLSGRTPLAQHNPWGRAPLRREELATRPGRTKTPLKPPDLPDK